MAIWLGHTPSPTGPWGWASERGSKPREWLSQKSLSKRHVFSAIYLLFNSKVPKKAGLSGFLSLSRSSPGPKAQGQPAGLTCQRQAAQYILDLYFSEDRQGAGAAYGCQGPAPCLRSGQFKSTEPGPLAQPAGAELRSELREWLSQKSLSKRHVFSAIPSENAF